MRIEILLYDGFDEIDALGPFEVLSANFDVELVSLDRPGTVTTARGLQLVTGAALGRPDGVIVPGGGWQDRATEGAWAQSQRRRLPDTVAELAPDLSWVASVCTGALLLAAAGLLTDRYATTNRRVHDELRPHVREVVDERVVEDGDRITAAGLTAGLDLGLWITERHRGTAAADAVATGMDYHRQGRVWRAPARDVPSRPHQA